MPSRKTPFAWRVYAPCVVDTQEPCLSFCGCGCGGQALDVRRQELEGLKEEQRQALRDVAKEHDARARNLDHEKKQVCLLFFFCVYSSTALWRGRGGSLSLGYRQ